MALTSGQCQNFNQFLFRRVPDWDKELAKDRFPYSYLYSGMYESATWPSFTGTTHTWDRVHVTRPNDNAVWEAMSADPCITTPCAPPRFYTGWGSTRNTYTKYHRDYQTPVFCFDQLRHIEEAEAQVAAIIEGHKNLPESIISDFLRQLSIAQADYWYSAGASDVSVVPTFDTAQPSYYLFGNDASLPTSKLTMGYLDNHVENLQYNGYFDRMFTPDGTFLITSDIQTHRELTVRNPELVRMYNGADFKKGGQFFSYGLAMKGVGNWSFKIDPEPIRAQRIAAGKLQRVWPYVNNAATVGKKPVFDTAYKNAQYQMYHVYNRAARKVYVGDTTPVSAEMKFAPRNLMGKWSWKNPDYFSATDPTTGVVCNFQNDKKNMGYFLAEFELGTKSIYPEIEMIIWAQREPQAIIDTARCASVPANAYQVNLFPYNAYDCSI